MEITETQKKEIRIFEQVLGHVNQIIPFDRFYVALYDRRNASLYFPVVRLEDKTCLTLPELKDGPWSPRPFAPEAQWPDSLWRSDAPTPDSHAPQAWLEAQQIGYSPAPFPHSWLIAPLKARGGAVMGVLVAEDLHRERAYGDDLQTWFTAAANRVAGTLYSLRLVESLRAVNRVGQRLTAGARQSVTEILELIHTEAGQLMDTRDMFVALLDAPTRKLSFPLFYINGESVTWPSREVHLEDPKQRKLTEEVLHEGKPLNVPNFSQWFVAQKRPVPAEPPKSWLGVPLKTSNRTLGVIALQNDEVENLYSADDQEILEAMASQVSAALANAQLVERLQAVNEVGQRLTSGAQLGENEILDLIYEQAKRLMDTNNMYVALYNPDMDIVRFPFMRINGEMEEVEPRSGGEGRTEWIIHNREPILIRTEEEDKKWYEEPERKEYIGKLLVSWMGVPMISGDQVVGVIAVYHETAEYVYNEDDLKVLQTMANQVAVALENAHLVADLIEARAEIAQTASLLERTSIAADFVHRINNLTGTIPIWVNEIRSYYHEQQESVPLVEDYLNNIELDADELLRAAERLKVNELPQEINVVEVTKSLVRGLQVQTPHLKIEVHCKPDVPPVNAVRSDISNALGNIIQNGIEAMHEDGYMEIHIDQYIEQDKQWARIEVIDSGPGIPPEVSARIFSSLYTTKTGHQGYGLWRAQDIIQRLGGSIKYQNNPTAGVTFTILLPSHTEV